MLKIVSDITVFTSQLYKLITIDQCYKLVSVGPCPGPVLLVSIKEGLEVVGYMVAGEAGNIGAGLGELSRDPEWSEGGPDPDPGPVADTDHVFPR